ncbi:uncharacterized protein LOC129405843 isoform X4 [Sorex araneus]|uniref:uncharacterized protein LOC129405843 isoform X4 n=1 Tax=Sorex araneus TaxID=42254 RepID=UPI002433FFFD|nr:uncharacterized protein LOC129405843 isoform X4 [Sorex araneus]
MPRPVGRLLLGLLALTALGLLCAGDPRDGVSDKQSPPGPAECNLGYFKDQDHPETCHPCRSCENAAETRPCTPTSDRVCAGDARPGPEGSGSGGGAGPLLACVLGSLAVLAVLAIVFLVLIKFPRGRACLSDTGRRLWRLRRCLLDRGNLLAGAVRMLSGPLPAPLLKALPQPSRDAPDPEEAVASLGDRPPADQPGMELLPREPGRVEQE